MIENYHYVKNFNPSTGEISDRFEHLGGRVVVLSVGSDGHIMAVFL